VFCTPNFKNAFLSSPISHTQKKKWTQNSILNLNLSIAHTQNLNRPQNLSLNLNLSIFWERARERKVKRAEIEVKFMRFWGSVRGEDWDLGCLFLWEFFKVESFTTRVWGVLSVVKTRSRTETTWIDQSNQSTERFAAELKWLWILRCRELWVGKIRIRGGWFLSSTKD